jgi:hypothetical protein
MGRVGGGSCLVSEVALNGAQGCDIIWRVSECQGRGQSVIIWSK